MLCSLPFYNLTNPFSIHNSHANLCPNHNNTRTKEQNDTKDSPFNGPVNWFLKQSLNDAYTWQSEEVAGEEADYGGGDDVGGGFF